MYIIRSNIFKPGTDSQKQFERYKIQVSVVHRPSDHEFNAYLQSLDRYLHDLTGEWVAFFPFIDPSPEWLEAVKGSRFTSWWDYQRQWGMPFDDALAQQIAIFFGLRWDDLPALVVSPSLWTGETVTISTSTELLEQQFQVLTDLSTQVECPNVGDITHVLEENFHLPVQYQNRDTRFISSFYEFLETFHRDTNRFDQRYWKMVANELASIRTKLAAGRDSEAAAQINDEDIETEIEAATFFLVAPAKVLSQAYGYHSQDLNLVIPGFSGLERESRLMVETAEMVGWFLNFMAGRDNPGFHLGDFTPEGQGYWKALEYELNLSLVQAARKSRNIEMPKFFTLFKPDVSEKATTVKVGRKNHNLNQKDTHSIIPGRHRFLMLGDCWFAINQMLNDPMDTLQNDIVKLLGQSLSSNALAAWDTIRDLRNRGSHTHPLSQNDVIQIKNDITTSRIFEQLGVIKTAMR